MADFTEVFKQTQGLVSFSPNGEYLATAVQQRLVIRESQSLQILQLFNCTDLIQHVSWSQGSDLILVASYKLGIFQVFSLEDEEWTGKVDEGILGCSKVLWAPDGRNILSFSEYQLRITIWSLVSRDSSYIQFPKHTDKGYGFRSDGKYFAMCERIDSKDYVAIFDCSDWTLQKRFPVDTNDLHDLSWSPDGRFIAVWESFLHYKMYIYRPDGRLAGSYSAYEDGLGIKKVQWSSSGQFLAIGSFDEQCRLLNHYTWNPLITFEHPKHITEPAIKHYKEVDLTAIQLGKNGKSWTNSKPKLQYELRNTPCAIPIFRPDPQKPNPKIGIGLVEFNSTGSLLVTRNDSQPLTLWIWDIAQCKQIAIIQQTEQIKNVRWNPLIPDQLAFCCSSGLLYLWEKSFGCDAIEVPAVSFHVNDFKWNPDGKSLVLLDKDKFCLSFLVE